MIHLKNQEESSGFERLFKSYGVRTVLLDDISDIAIYSGPLVAIIDDVNDLVIARLFQDREEMPVIMVVENANAAMKEAYQYGADFVVSRPFDLENPVGFRGY